MVYILYNGDIMLVKELLDMKLRDILDEFCFVYSPECGYLYGVSRWDDVEQMWEEFDLEDEYCFEGDHIIAWPMEVDFDAEVLELEGLRNVLDYLGIPKKGEEEGGGLIF